MLDKANYYSAINKRANVEKKRENANKKYQNLIFFLQKIAKKWFRISDQTFTFAKLFPDVFLSLR